MIDQLIENAISEGVFPGASLIVFKDKNILWDKMYGYSQLIPKQEKMHEDIIFDIASLTKPISIATLFMIATQENKCSIDSTIGEYFRVRSQHSKSLEGVTIRQLLNHTSGLPDWKPYYKTNEKIIFITSLILQEQPLSKPGVKTLYSDLGYILLGKILEALYKEELDLLFRKKVSGPLNMHNTFYNSRKRNLPFHHFTHKHFAATEVCPWRKKVLKGEVHDDNCYAMEGVAGHAGLFSNTKDIFKWILELMNASKGESEMITQDTFKLFCSVPERNRKEGFFTLGFDTPSEPSSSGKYFSDSSIGHLGYTGCSFWWDLKKNFGIIFLSNRVHPTRKNDKIKKFRPLLHDTIVQSLKLDQNSV